MDTGAWMSNLSWHVHRSHKSIADPHWTNICTKTVLSCLMFKALRVEPFPHLPQLSEISRAGQTHCTCNGERKFWRTSHEISPGSWWNILQRWPSKISFRRNLNDLRSFWGLKSCKISTLAGMPRLSFSVPPYQRPEVPVQRLELREINLYCH